MAESLEDFQRLRKGSSNLTRLLLVTAVVAAGMWWQFIRLPQQVEITKMVPGLNGAMTQLECWLTLEFSGTPPDDARNVMVVFEGEAIQGGEQRFDWSYIANHDMTASGARGRNTDTTPDEAPTQGTATRVNFPLRAKDHVDDASFNMPLVATVYWGGVKQDTLQRSAGHAYRHEGSPL